MKKPSAQSITTLEESADVERHRRFRNYAIAMSVRMVCVILVFLVHGWWLLVPAIGAVLLPYIAVVIANNGSRRAGSPIESPDSAAIVIRDPAVYRPTVPGEDV